MQVEPVKRPGYWILDTGIDLDHSDLTVDVSRSITVFTRGRDASSADDGNRHGTHVAGTIAAKNNDIGVIGVAYDATTVAVKVLDSRGSGSYSGVIQGVDYVGANAKAGDVANMSLGGPVSQALDDAILAASKNGIYFALAAGNDGSDANNYSPARVNGNNIFTVSAMNSTDSWASWSNWGNPPVDYCAPGVSILSTWKGGGYNTISGTSMATPHVAGVLLLTGGSPKTSGYVKGDPDGNPDPIASSK
jgi:subtilisin family serine protease